MGCTGNALATGIDAPLGPKVSLIPDSVPVVSGGTGGGRNAAPVCPWNYV